MALPSKNFPTKPDISGEQSPNRPCQANTYISGWMGYFCISEEYSGIPEIDGWIRRCVRMCYWKQWRWCRTKIRELLKLGTILGAAIRAGLNRKIFTRFSLSLAKGTWAHVKRLNVFFRRYLTPSLSMRALNVFGSKPSNSAAPPGP
ncbi:MAG TPA: group II intron maturase-specific domain-containing protein [Geobacteraceae bacterium]|nr:group II intron maturase-specific domain-containing protein [Geobacteraceae bacterium]